MEVCKQSESIQELTSRIFLDVCSIERLNHWKFISIEDHIILWYSKDLGYFYTDLEYHMLFDAFFPFATPFSDGQAIIFFSNMPCILDVRDQTITTIPKEIDFNHCRKNIVHGNIASFHKDYGKWGSYTFCKDTFFLDIPFLWDRLEFSRYPDYVYGGNQTEAYLIKFCATLVYRFHKLYFSSISKFDQMRSVNLNFYKEKTVLGGFDTSSLGQELSKPIDIRDQYFNENLETNYGYEIPNIIDSNIKNYELVKGIYLKKDKKF